MRLNNAIFHFENFSGYSSIKHGISTTVLGSIKERDTLQVDRELLKKFARSIGSNDEVVYMQQIHSGNVTIITDIEPQSIPKTDGLVTNKKNITLAVMTADCLPILFYDSEKAVIGVAHAGYRGLLNHIIENTVSVFISRFNSDPKNIIVGIGPSIETKCYEVGKEVIEKFEKTFPTFKNMFVTKDSKFYPDLRNIALQVLLSKGILKEHIEIMAICTKCNEQFYSYRGGDGDKRFTSVISLI